MNIKSNTQQIEEVSFQKTQTLMRMFAERYLGTENAESFKMALEMSDSWNCKQIVY